MRKIKKLDPTFTEGSFCFSCEGTNQLELTLVGSISSLIVISSVRLDVDGVFFRLSSATKNLI